MRRFIRLRTGHSKKIENHVHMVALDTTWYNYSRVNAQFACPLQWPLALSSVLGTSAIL